MPVKYAVIGNAVVDVFRGVQTLPPLDHSTDNMRVGVIERCEEPGGNAINTALVLAKISDASITALSAFGADAFGEAIRTSCETGRPFSKQTLLRGTIKLLNANADFRDATGTAIVLQERSSNRTMFLYDSACNARVDVPFLRLHIDVLTDASFLHISGFGGLPGIDRGKNLQDFVELLKLVRKRNADIKIMLDVMFLDEQTILAANLRETLTTLLEQIDYFAPNEHEAMQWSKMGPRTDLAEVVRAYNRHVRFATIIKQGPRGVTIFPRDGAAKSVEPTMIVESADIVDTVGAGDAWCAGFLDALGKIEPKNPARLADAAMRGNDTARTSLFGQGGNRAFFR